MTNVLTQAEVQTFTTIAGLMVPASATHNVPGADDPSIMAEIVDDANTHAIGGVKNALAAWEALDAPDDAGRVAEFLDDHGAEAALLQAVVNRVYYRNDAVMASLGMEARAPFPKGFEVEEHNWSILDPVRAKEPLWRQA
ncbi:hypothetical protein ACMU_04860 [Actibacterium mucosum KCTC 23349]|uniref:Gluconate 2-dehydrogenase subunit 3 family protein n=1 Tax=Actibacterium mucosum KCTC 23349 TaxID=1454373 RepID=A0A037ZEE2_9RHOB|nr:hypothetical protein [Actibacterium mucosum]KAJ53963.1 hypothetical protein ACMU_04860 [Actibacterium mucosum KCTC 23349]